jgi:hypothetical protein
MDASAKPEAVKTSRAELSNALRVVAARPASRETVAPALTPAR